MMAGVFDIELHDAEENDDGSDDETIDVEEVGSPFVKKKKENIHLFFLGLLIPHFTPKI